LFLLLNLCILPHSLPSSNFIIEVITRAIRVSTFRLKKRQTSCCGAEPRKWGPRKTRTWLDKLFYHQNVGKSVFFGEVKFDLNDLWYFYKIKKSQIFLANHASICIYISRHQKIILYRKPNKITHMSSRCGVLRMTSFIC
jgi:hypothetical protein